MWQAHHKAKTRERAPRKSETVSSLCSSRGGYYILYSLQPLRRDGKGLTSTQWQRSDFISAQQHRKYVWCPCLHLASSCFLLDDVTPTFSYIHMYFLLKYHYIYHWINSKEKKTNMNRLNMRRLITCVNLHSSDLKEKAGWWVYLRVLNRTLVLVLVLLDIINCLTTHQNSPYFSENLCGEKMSNESHW